MPRTADATLTVTAQAVNRTRGPMREAAGDFDNLAKVAQRAPEQFSKAANVLNLVQGAAGEMGGAVAEATGKLSGLASMAAAGGPLGLAIAGTTALAAAGAAVWKTYALEASNADAATKSIDKVFDGMRKRLEDQQRGTLSLADQVKYYGKSANEVRLIKAQEDAQLQDKSLPLVRADVDAMKARAAAAAKEAEQLKIVIGTRGEVYRVHDEELKKQAEALAREAAKMEEGLKISEEKRADLAKEIPLLAQLIGLENQHTAAVTKGTAAKKQRKDTDEDLLSYAASSEQARKAIDKIKKDAEKAAAEQEQVARESAACRTKIEGDAQAVIQQKNKETSMIMAQGFGEAFGALIAGSVEGSKVARQNAVTTARSIIAAAAAKAAAENMASWAGTGPWGVAIGAVTSAAVYATVMALTSKLTMAQGGFVRGTPGTDKVPGWLSDGEYVMTRDEVAAARRGVMPSRLNAQGGGGASVVLNASFSSIVPHSSQSMQEAARVLGKEMRGLQRRGYRVF